MFPDISTNDPHSDEILIKLPNSPYIGCESQKRKEIYIRTV